MGNEDARQFEKRFHERNWDAWRRFCPAEREHVKQLMRKGFDMHTAMCAVRRGLF